MAPPPALLDETVGREDDLAALRRLVTSGQARLVNVLGPGGVGKTGLVTELGAIDWPRCSVTASVFAPLANAQTTADVALSICAARRRLPVDVDGPVAPLIRFLRERHMLLVCDNFEHVVDALP